MIQETSLETEMDEIRRLSTLRDEAIAKRKEGFAGLGQSKEYAPRAGWVDPGDDVEKGILSEVLWKGPLPTTGAAGSSWADLPEQLARIKVADLFLTDASETGALTQDRVPVLRSAVVLDALSAIPGQVLSEGALSCYFRIVYELNCASKADQLMGGACGGGQRVPQTAFVTNWCVRAIQSIAGVLENTARMIESFSAFQEPKPASVPQIWWDQHHHTQKLSILTALGQADHHLLVAFDAAGDLVTEAELKSKLTRIIQEAVSHTGSFASVRVPGGNSFALERAKASCQALKELLAGSLQTTDPAGGSSVTVDLGKLKDAMVKSAKELRTVLEPSRKYFRLVLDHELVTEVFHPQRKPDAAELLFAGDGLSRLGREDAQTLGSTLEHVASLVTNHGRVPSHRPFDVKEKGYVLHVAASEVIHAFAQLSAREHWPVSADVAQRFLRHFTETWRDEFRGWRHERDDAQGLCQWWLCGLSVLALDAFVDMLDARINQIVLRHFSVRQPGEIKFELDSLFYPDYGLAALLSGRKSSAEVLQRMRAHVVGVELSTNSLHSAVFYGPPGTGKTTLPEALARTSDAPLVEVTPSDIVLGGIEKTEARARVVFEALSLLSHAVILFDEFDSILWDRAARSSGEGILQFVTPGMLPKLKKLYDRAKDRRTAFILSTNLIGGLDPAAIREGRFDEKLGIYPPDIVSRTGRLWMELVKMKEDTNANPGRLHEVVAQAAGLAMGFLARPDSFTKSKKDGPKEGSPIHYILHGKGKPIWPNPEKTLQKDPMADYSGQPTTWKLNPLGVRDWKEWKLVAFLDQKSKGNLAALQSIIDKASKLKGLEDLARELNEPDRDKWEESLVKLLV